MRAAAWVLLAALSPALADDTPPPGYWKFEEAQVFFCFDLAGEPVCSQLPLERYRQHLINLYGKKV